MHASYVYIYIYKKICESWNGFHRSQEEGETAAALLLSLFALAVQLCRALQIRNVERRPNERIAVGMGGLHLLALYQFKLGTTLTKAVTNTRIKEAT